MAVFEKTYVVTKTEVCLTFDASVYKKIKLPKEVASLRSPKIDSLKNMAPT